MILPIIVVPCLLEQGVERRVAAKRGCRQREDGWEGRADAAESLAGVWANRFRRLPRRQIGARLVPVASGSRVRLLGLALLDRDQAGPGLLIPRCSAVHTFGMRFELDLVFLDRDGREIARRSGVPPRRFVRQRGAAAVLEFPSAEDQRGGEFVFPDDLGRRCCPIGKRSPASSSARTTR
jgi:hypothetical protein